jgi:uncharacterized lipoprotein YddW (UPF0748 family)
VNSARGALAPVAASWVTLVVAACSPIGGPQQPPPRERPVEAPAPVLRAEPVGPPETAVTVDPAPPLAVVPLRPTRSFAEVRGLWVVRWTMSSERQVRDMVEHAAAAGFNTLIVQVRGRGDAYYLSSLEPRAESLQGPPDFDPLALTIREAHLRGMAVHAWVNTHLVWGPAPPPRSPFHLVNANPEWLAVPRPLARDLYGADPRRSDYFEALRRYAAERPQTVEGIYSSPSHPEVRARLLAVWMDLLARYDLDGLHFDYIRYPSAEFDYSRGALERFRSWVAHRIGAERLADLDRAAARDPLAFTTALPAEWDEFRRDQITSLVAEIYREVKTRRPDMVVSAAVVAEPETAYGTRFQDWQGWLREGIIDIAVPMAYTPDNGRFQSLVRSARRAAGDRGRVWAGIGAYLDTPAGTISKIDLARTEDAGGVVLFSYDWAVGEGRGSPADPFLRRVGRERFGIQ